MAIRIIPVILHRGHTLVKGKKFNSWRSVGNVMQAAKIYAAREVDELCILNIGATPNNERPDFEMVKQLTDGNFSPITIGGGVRSIEDVQELLRAGADKVVICTAAFEKPEFIRACTSKFGRQAIVVSIDVLPIHPRDGFGLRVMSHCGTIEGKGWPTALGWAKQCVNLGVGEILLTNIQKEGQMNGYDIKLIKGIAENVNIPVIAHGGCGSYEDMYLAIQAGASAVTAGALFQFTDSTPKGAAEYLKAKGIEVRL